MPLLQTIFSLAYSSTTGRSVRAFAFWAYSRFFFASGYPFMTDYFFKLLSHYLLTTHSTNSLQFAGTQSFSHPEQGENLPPDSKAE